MSKLAKTSIMAMKVAMVTCAVSYADDTTEILNGQINLDAAINVVLEGETDQASGTTLTAVGIANAFTVDVVERHDLDNSQEFSGNVAVRSDVDAGIINGSAMTTSTAMGNSVSLIHDNGMDVTSTQTAANGSTVRADAALNVDSYVLNSITVATAAANAVESLAYGDEVNMILRQDSGADVEANASAIAPSGGLGWGATLAAVSTANSVKIEGYYLGPEQSIELDQSNRGAVTSRALLVAGGGAVNTNVSTQAAGNSASVQNENGDVVVDGLQDNAGIIEATTDVYVGNFDVDFFTVSSEGVGNSVLVSNFGRDVTMGVGQINTAEVTATTNFYGGAGGDVIAAASAFGNAQTSYICSECPVRGYGDVNQTNSANINAAVNAQMTTGGSLIGSASAVGNTATYQTVTPGN